MIEKEITLKNGLKIIGHKYDDKDKANLLKLFNTWIENNTPNNLSACLSFVFTNKYLDKMITTKIIIRL